MRYPKPGYKNPEVGVWVFDLSAYLDPEKGKGKQVTDELFELDWEGRHPVDDSIITEVTWVGNRTLIVKEANRNADNGSVVLFDLSLEGLTTSTRSEGAVVRKLGKEGEQGDNGWIDEVCSYTQFLRDALSPFSSYSPLVPEYLRDPIVSTSETVSRWLVIILSIPRYRPHSRGVQPHRVIQSRKLLQTPISHSGRVGSYWRGSRC